MSAAISLTRELECAASRVGVLPGLTAGVFAVDRAQQVVAPVALEAVLAVRCSSSFSIPVALPMLLEPDSLSDL